MVPQATPLVRSVSVTLLAVTLVVALAGPAVSTVAADSHVPEPEERDEMGFHFVDSAAPGENTSIDMYGIAPKSSENPIPAGVEHEMNFVQIQWPLNNHCTEADLNVVGIDRGNNNSGMVTDDSVLQNVEQAILEETTPEEIPINLGPGDDRETIWAKFYSRDSLGGDPPVVNQGGSADRLLLGFNDCVTPPSPPGWYRATAYWNGTVTAVHDESLTDEYAVGDTVETRVTSNWEYICDCENEEEAREQLGPPPNEESRPGGAATATPTPEQATETPGSDGGTTGETTTETSASTPDPRQATETPAPETAAPTEGASGGDGGGDGGAAGDADGVDGTPTASNGPGFGAVLAIGALLAAALTFRRR